MSKKLAAHNEQPGAVQVNDAQPGDLMTAIAHAVSDPRIDVEKMSKLLDMHERIVADQRKVAYVAAMSRLQAALPQMGKFGQAKNSKFARLEDIDVVVRPLMAAEGFSVSMDEESSTEKTSTFAMTMSHRDGHSEVKRKTFPIDVAAKNREGQSVRPAIQDAGSTVTYARRYLLKMHLNIVETNEDTDGERPEFITDEQVKNIETLLQDTSSNVEAFLKMIAGAPSVREIQARDYKRIMNSLEEKLRLKK